MSTSFSSILAAVSVFEGAQQTLRDKFQKIDERIIPRSLTPHSVTRLQRQRTTYPILSALSSSRVSLNTMSNVNIQTTISPFTQEAVCTRPLLSESELDNVIAEAVKAQKSWRKVPLDDRIAIAEKWVVS